MNANRTAKRSQYQQRKMRLESLERRSLMAGDFRSLDGVGNNLSQSQWGSTEEDFLRLAPSAYQDGISAPAGAARKSAREISDLVSAQNGVDLLNNRDLSAMVYAWGQFLDHDIDLTDTGTTELFSISVPKGDPYFDPTSTGTKTIPLLRSTFDPATGTAKGNPRQQVNSITAFIDGSQVYGTTAERAAALRTFQGGLLKVSEGNLLPLNTDGLPNSTSPPTPASSFFLAGDIRANENIELTAMQTLFMREHNRVATQLLKDNPTWKDEQLYQEARRIVGAEMQAITYNEFLPALLGPNALPAYRGYNSRVNPGISNEFATAAFRLGHSMLGSDVEFLDNQGNETRDPIELRDAFFNPEIIKQEGIDEVLKYLASDRAQEIDVKVVDDVRNFLFGPSGSGGLDLAALNIQRGRDHGLSDYNSTRVAMGLPAVKSFADITKNVGLQTALKQAYGDVNKIDLWVGGLAEDHVKGASVGPTFQRILADQFTRLRDGDRFWYENNFRGRQLDTLRNTSLADVIRRNTTTTNLQQNVFVFRAEIGGRVIFDANGNGRLKPIENGIAGVSVRLLDADGAVVASTTTTRDGGYRFTSLDLGSYRVEITPPNGMRITTRPLQAIAITKGMVVDRQDIGLARTNSGAPRVSSLSSEQAASLVFAQFDPLGGTSTNFSKRRR